MKKLQKGDFVTNLDVYQFEELMKICNEDWLYEDDQIVVYMNESIWLAGYIPTTINNRLTFDEFKERAINTSKKQLKNEQKHNYTGGFIKPAKSI